MVTEGSEMSRPPSSQNILHLYRVSDRDLTEIELHSVDSINDLHRMHNDHSQKGMRPPHPAYIPTVNGNVYTCDMSAVSQRGHPANGTWQSRLQDMLTPTLSRAYTMGCAIITLLLLIVSLIFYLLVQQGGAIQMLTEALEGKEAAASDLSLLIQDLQELKHNLTTMERGT